MLNRIPKVVSLYSNQETLCFMQNCNSIREFSDILPKGTSVFIDKNMGDGEVILALTPTHKLRLDNKEYDAGTEQAKIASFHVPAVSQRLFKRTKLLVVGTSRKQILNYELYTFLFPNLFSMPVNQDEFKAEQMMRRAYESV